MNSGLTDDHLWEPYLAGRIKSWNTRNPPCTILITFNLSHFSSLGPSFHAWSQVKTLLKKHSVWFWTKRILTLNLVTHIKRLRQLWKFIRPHKMQSGLLKVWYVSPSPFKKEWLSVNFCEIFISKKYIPLYGQSYRCSLPICLTDST